MAVTFQTRVLPWLLACFGAEIAADRVERNHRFLEEALELVQSTGCTRSEAHQIVDYVFDRPVGEANQEAGGVMVTLAALCLVHGIDMHEAAEIELARIWTKVEQIRAKQAAKPKHSPLPVHVGPAQLRDPGPVAIGDTSLAAISTDHALVPRGKWSIGDKVTKTGGSAWSGRICGFYSTALTPIGYAIESEFHPGSVQIYPETALADQTR